MSEKKISFVDKIRVCLKYLKDPRYMSGSMIRCDVCGSTNIRIDKSVTENLTTDSEYTCLNCGGTCIAHQEWR